MEDLHRLDDDAVVIPECETEVILMDCFSLSLQRSFDGVIMNYEIVRDYAARSENDPVEVYRLLRIMLSEFNG